MSASHQTRLPSVSGRAELLSQLFVVPSAVRFLQTISPSRRHLADELKFPIRIEGMPRQSGTPDFQRALGNQVAEQFLFDPRHLRNRLRGAVTLTEPIVQSGLQAALSSTPSRLV